MASSAITLLTNESKLLLIVLSSLLTGTSGIRIMKMKVPSRVQVGEPVTLACQFDLEGKTLYSLNWWRGSEQFYQFSPNSQEQITVYHSPGITVDVGRSGRDVVVLRNVSQATAGQYKCEVLADYPSFEKDSEMTSMEVIEVPKHPPYLAVKRVQWAPNEILKANCTSPEAVPPPELHWYMNGDKLLPKYSHLPTDAGGSSSMDPLISPLVAERRGVSSTTSQLTLLLRSTHFIKGGQATLTCAATLPGLYQMSSEAILTLPGFRAASPSQKLYGAANPHLGTGSCTSIVLIFLLLLLL